MKIRLDLEIDEERIRFDGIEDASKSEIKLKLSIAMNDWLNEIDDWAHTYNFIEDKRDKKRED